MATTDQLQKASRGNPCDLTLNAFSRSRYIKALEDAGFTGVRSLSKVQAFKRVKAAGIQILPSWH